MRLTGAAARPRLVVAIPARDEAERIGACLRALVADRSADDLLVLLLANNTADGTAAVAANEARRLDLPLVVEAVDLPPDQAHAGEARRLAMGSALELCGPDDILATTDADGRVEPGWRDRTRRAIASGADVVCGRAMIDPDEAARIPRILHDDDRRETSYFTLLDRLRALLDPDEADPWPRHGEESGASIAVRPAAFRASGGVPSVAIGEDRALVARLRLDGARIRHDPLVRVVVSGRLDGRAADGMADTMRRRMVRRDEHVDDRLEPVSERLRRVRLHRLFMAFRAEARCPAPAEAARFGVPDAILSDALGAPVPEAGWDRIERLSPFLRARTAIPHAAIGPHMVRAARLVARLGPERETAFGPAEAATPPRADRDDRERASPPLSA